MKEYIRKRIEANQRYAHIRACSRCGAVVLVGPDADDVAYEAAVDAEPVDRVHEVAALLSGRYSCDYTCGKLHLREPWHTGEWQASHGRTIKQVNEYETVIYLEHRCGVSA